MSSVYRAILAGLAAALLAAGGGAALAVTTASVPATAAPVTAPVAPAERAAMNLPAVSAVDAVVGARAAVETARVAAAETRYTCEPTADARVVDGIIVNKDCPDLHAARERAQREYAEQLSIGDSAVGPDYCDPSTGMKLDGTPCPSGQVQYEYWTDPGEAALQACREQTGMTTGECRADAAAGNAN
ncbi:hypothetical protein [Pseudonocardia sp. NPDC049635]|uniref:hypothetical protein n=1 Tax=Pseudonocardia sp. NPDC049635 TaxID=3155506 RepID=UPI0033EFEE82